MSEHAQKLPEHSHAVATKRDEAELVSDRAQPLDPRVILQRFARAPDSLRSPDILRLQQTHGNRFVQRLLSQFSPAPSLVQAKLTVNAPGDQYEQEADRIAEAVTRMPAAGPEEPRGAETPAVTRLSQPSQVTGGAFEAGEAFEQQLRAERGQGQPLPTALREDFEAKFGADFGGVRVHADAQSDSLNQSIQAQAFTTGQDIFFRQGAYGPGNRDGRGLIAHELTHVVQQQPAGTACKTPERGGKALSAAWVLEARAQAAAERTALPRIASSGIMVVQRKAEPAHPFPGREQKTVGVGEQVILSVSTLLAKRNRGQLEWVAGPGSHNMGQLGQTDADGKAEFTAGGSTGHVTLICRTKYVNQELEHATFSIVEPNGGHMEQVPGTNIRHIPDQWNVAFVGNQFLHPQKVSFHGIEFREEQAPAQYYPSKNDWLAQTGDHKQGPWVDVEAATSTKGSQVTGDDWVSSGIHQGLPRQKPADPIQWNHRPHDDPAKMTWSIPWSWKLSGTPGPGKVFATVDHVAYDYGNGEAQLTKGGVDVSAKATDQAQWYFPNVDDNIERIKYYYDPSRHTPGYGRPWPEIETRLRKLPTNPLADLVYMARENAWSPTENLDPSMTLDMLITEDARLWGLTVP